MTVLLLLVLGLMNAPASPAQEDVGVTEITPNVLVFATKSGNVVASVGNDGALLVGTPSAESTPQISRVLAGRTKSPVRYVVIAPEPLSQSEADAGWGRKEAFVAMQEKALERLGRTRDGAVIAVPGQTARSRCGPPAGLVFRGHIFRHEWGGDPYHSPAARL